MIRLRVLDILTERRLSKYWLNTRLGLSDKNMNNMLANRTKAIRYENIEKLCTILECAPSDLFEIIPEQTTAAHK